MRLHVINNLLKNTPCKNVHFIGVAAGAIAYLRDRITNNCALARLHLPLRPVYLRLAREAAAQLRDYWVALRDGTPFPITR